MRNTGRLIALAAIASSIWLNDSRAAAELSVSPTATSITPGTFFNVDVNVSGIQGLYGFQFDLHFNPDVIAAVSSSSGSFLSRGGSTYFIPGTNDNGKGVVGATAGTLLGPVSGVDGTGNLAVLSFEAIKSGISSLAFSGVNLIDSAFNSIASTPTGGSVTVGSAVMAPEIDASSAVSALTLLLGSLAVLRGRRQRKPVG